MLTRPQVQRYSAEAGLRNIMVAENEIVLTYLLQLMAERGILDKLAFKGGTCLSSPRTLSAWPCPRSSPRSSGPVTNVTRHETSTTSACSRLDLWTNRLSAGSSSSSFGRRAMHSTRKLSWRSSTMPAPSIGTISGSWSGEHR